MIAVLLLLGEVESTSSDGWGGTLAFFVLALVGIGFVIAYGKEGGRRDALRNLARQLGFSFSPVASADLNEITGTMELYALDGRFRHENVLTLRREDFGIAMFDVRGVSRKGYPSWLKHTASSMCVAGAEFPRAIVTKATVNWGITPLRSPDDVEYPDDPRFSSDYLLRGKNVLDAISPALIALVRKHDISFEAGGDWLRVYRVNQTVPPEKYVSFIEATLQLARLLQPKLTVDFPKFDDASAAVAVSGEDPY
jgi:hypothetical protein